MPAPEEPVPSTPKAPFISRLPPATDPVLTHSAPEQVEAPSSRPSGLHAILGDLRELRAGRPPRNKLVVPVLGMFGFSVVLLVLAVVVAAVRGPASGDKETLAVANSGSAASVSSASAPSSAVSGASALTSARENPKPAPSSAAPAASCSLAGEAKVIAPRAVVSSGVEAASLGASLGVGFASSAREAVAVALEPGSLAGGASARGRALAADARRVTPLLVQGKLALVADTDKKGDRLAGRRVVATNPAIDIGADGNALVWAPHGKDSTAKLFSLESDAPVEALRAVPLAGAKGVALAFRQAGSVWIGIATGEGVLTPVGGLKRVAGLGKVGSPTIAVSGDNVAVAWADRASDDAPWQISWTHLGIGSDPQPATSFAVPDGGLGVQAMSPSLTALGQGRFVLAWAEGPVSSHQVRAAALNADGAATGSAFAVSAPGANAGQPQVAVGSDGRGVVAFFVARGKTYEVHAAPISCR